MSWLKVDDGLFSNPKILEVSGPARLLYLAGLCHCAGGLTDGRISKKAGPVLLARRCHELPGQPWRWTCEPGTMSSRPSGQRTHALCPPS